MDSGTDPVEVLFAESQRLGAFTDFWGRRVEIEEAYLDSLGELRIPDPPSNGQLKDLAHKTHELLLDELEERRRGFKKLKAAYKALTDEFYSEVGYNHFDQWGRAIKPSLLRIDGLAAEVATAESIAERSAVEAREKESSPMKKETQPRSNVLSRFLDKAKNEPEIPYDTSSFLSADSAYRQKIQKINDEKYVLQYAIMPQAERYVEHNRRCIVALRHVVSAFSAMHSDLAQVLNITSSQLCIVSSSVDASIESASFAERLDKSFTYLIQPYRYTSYDSSSSLRPTTMLFGCPLPDDLTGASLGQHAAVKAFEMILSSAAKANPNTLYQAICVAHQQQANDIKLSALQLESLWDPSQLNGGHGATNYLAKAESPSLLVYFLTRLPEPFLPLYDPDIKRLAKLDPTRLHSATGVFAKAGNRMGIARRYSLARLFLTIRRHQYNMHEFTTLFPVVFQILTRKTPDLLPLSRVADTAILNIRIDNTDASEDALMLPRDSTEELRHAGLLM